MAGELAGRVALVTGVGRVGQIGHAVAAGLGAAGARLVLADRSAEILDERVREFAVARIGAAPAPGDLTEPHAARAAVGLAEARFGGLDIVVNVAGGLTSYGPFEETDIATFEREIAINLRTVFCVCQAAVPSLRRRGGGLIVNFTSIAVLQPQPNLAVYLAAKGGVAALTRALARELRGDGAGGGIRVNALAPEAVRTSTNVQDMGSEAKYVELSDVVRTVLWLASDEARAVTGQIIPLVAGSR
ncbi:MAG: SDR family NAD(P)-dependent oxidoreductase [Gemmatimonadota bacterium]